MVKMNEKTKYKKYVESNMMKFLGSRMQENSFSVYDLILYYLIKIYEKKKVNNNDKRINK